MTLTGPRQSGKTTLAKMLYPKWAYVNLEAINDRQFAQEDPVGFLRQFEDRNVIIDEVQRVPELLSQIQVMVDADANKAVWKNARPVTDFVQFLGGGKLAKHQTVVRAAYDDANLYLLVEGMDTETDKLIAEATKRDDPVWKDNNFEFFFAPPAFGAEYVHFSINHKGAIYDTKSRSPVDRDLNFNLKAETAVKVLKDRWVAELKVPFSELGGAPKPGDSWPVNVGRGRNAKDSQDNATSSWSHEGRMHGIEGFRRILFSAP